MPQTNRTTLQALIDATIYTNNTNDITGDEVNQVCTDLNDSNVNWVADVETTLTNSNTKVPTSAAVLANRPIIIIVDAATFNALRTSSQLRIGYTYIIASGFTDAIWGYVWGVMCYATGTSTISDNGWAARATTTPVGPWVSITIPNNDLTDIVFNECVGADMVLTAAQADTYNTNGMPLIRANTPVFVEVTELIGNAVALFSTKLTQNGGAINDTGFYADAGGSLESKASSYLLDFANDLAIPRGPIYTLVSIDPLVATPVDVLPAPPGPYAWDVTSAMVHYQYNTSGYDADVEPYLQLNTATQKMWEDTAASSTFTNEVTTKMTPLTYGGPSGGAYLQARKLRAGIVNTTTTTDGTIAIAVVAQLIQVS